MFIFKICLGIILVCFIVIILCLVAKHFMEKHLQAIDDDNFAALLADYLDG